MEYDALKSCCRISLETCSRVISVVEAISLFACLIAQNVDIEPPKGFFAFIVEFIEETTLISHRVDFRDIIITAFLLLRGVFKEDRHLILPWILLQSIYIFVYVMSFFRNLVELQKMGFGMDFVFSDGYLKFIVVVYRLCAVLIVTSFYTELETAFSAIRLK